MSNISLGTKTSFQQYIRELESCERCSAEEAAADAALVAQYGLDALPKEHRDRFVNFCMVAVAMRVRGILAKPPHLADLEPGEWVNEIFLDLEDILKSYDPERSGLTTYLSNSVDYFMRSYAAENSDCGRYYKTSVSQLQRAFDKLTREYSRQPSDEELMKELNWGKRRLYNVRIADAEGSRVSLEEPLADNSELTLADTLVSDEPGVEETAERRIMLGKMRECLDQLPDDRSKYATIHCIALGKSYGKVGEELGASKEGVRKMVNRTLELLRTMMCG